MKLLDLYVKPATEPVCETSGAGRALSASPTALEADEWGLRRGRDLAAQSERLRKAGTDEFAAANFFAAAFDPDPTLPAGCADGRGQGFLTQLLGSPECHALYSATRPDDTASAIAAGHYAEQLSELKEDDRTGVGAARSR